MLTDPERSFIIQAQALLAQALAGSAPALITTEAEFDAAYAAAATGGTLALAQSFTYSKALTLYKAITLLGPSTTTGRMTKDEPLPTFQNGIFAPANDVQAIAIGVRASDPSMELFLSRGARTTLSRCRFLGDPVNGGLRGINPSGSAMTIVKCYVDDIGLPGRDTQAVCCWDTDGGLLMDDDYFCAAGETVMFGGGDSTSADRMPKNVVISRSTLTKNTLWYAKGWQIKNALEFKCCVNADVHDNVFEYAGVAEGQGAYLIVATVRNQDGGAPWSTIQNITIHHNTGAHASGVCNILGIDDRPGVVSVSMDGFTLSDNSFSEINWANPIGRIFLVNGAPKNVVLGPLTVDGGNLNDLATFVGIGQPPPTGLVMRGMQLPPSTYGWKVDGGASGRQALLDYMPDAQLDATIV